MSATSPDVKSIFGRALEIASPAERSAFLSEACAADPALRAEVEDLLGAMEGAGDFMKRPASPDSATIAHAPILEGPGTRIGPYKLLQQIGEGGMGVVYMAEQEQPVRRKVALKIIKPGMDSAQVVARFEAERQALAVMDHTHIARVFDAGTTETGRPYFVMELVHGVPITRFCDDAQLTPRERLELFVPVCQAIQHAHQKGIIHRDIKPSNVLVTMYDDRPVPKVIDFGVAKAIEQRLTERTLFTQFGALVGTFEYMSPEQAEMNAFGVDTRSDIYSLGVLLYELLTGTTPLEKQRLREAALGELVRLIKEEEPPRPSVRLSSSGDLPRIAAARKTEPARLSRLVRGEVDWIVMKCLEKDRTRRYETASGLAKDVEHHLRDEPVEACPPSAGYRLRKFARKNKRWLTTAAVIAALLALSAADGIWLLLRATRAEARARVALNRATQEAHHATQAERDALQQRDLATAQRQEAEEARQSLRQSLYDSDMQLAEEAWESGDIFRMRNLLEAHRPQPGMLDLRSFEWHYLRGLGPAVDGSRLALDGTFGRLSPDGLHYAYVVASSLPRSLGPAAGSKIVMRLRDVASGRPVRHIDPFPGERMSDDDARLTFSPDGKRFAVTMRVGKPPGRYDWRIKVFEWDTGRDVCTLADLGGAPVAAAFDHSGRRLAVVTVRAESKAGSDLKVWDVEGGGQRLAIPLPGRQTVHLQHSVAFRPDGSRIAALTKPVGAETPRLAGEVRAWDAGSGEEQLRFETGPASTALAYSPDGQWLLEVASDGASHRLRDAGSGTTILELTSTSGAGKTFSVAFSPDGSRLAGSSADGKVRIWNVMDVEAGGGRAPDRIRDGKIARLRQVEWSADGRQLCAFNESCTFMSWPETSRDPHVAVRGSGSTDWVAATASTVGSRFAASFEAPDGKRVLKVWDESGHVVFTANDALSSHAPYPMLSKRAVLSRDGNRLAHFNREAGGADGKSKTVQRLRAWDVATGREVFHRDVEIGDGHLYHAAFSPDGRRLATTWTMPKVSPGKPRRWDYWASIWDLETGRETLHLDLPVATRLAFSPDGRRLAGGLAFALMSPTRRQSEIRVWDAATGETVLTRTFAYSLIDAVTYNGNGALLAAAVGAFNGDVGDGEVIKVLDAASGQERHSFAGHRERIGLLAFSPDGRRLASLALSQTQLAEVKLWDLAGGREVLTLKPTRADPAGSNAFANCGFAFSSDGHRLFYLPGGKRRDAVVQVWDATPQPDERAEGSGPS